MRLRISCRGGLVLALALLLTAGSLRALNEESSERDQSDDEIEEEEEMVLGEGSEEIGMDQLEPAPADLVFDDRPIYKLPVPVADVHFSEPFADTEALKTRWVQSAALNRETGKPKYDGGWKIEEATENSLTGDLGLVLMNPTTHHALSAELTKPFEFTGKPLVVQYEVKFQRGQECGGAYVKLLMKPETGKLNLTEFDDTTKYTVMFGPDKCGKDIKVHLIVQHRSPKTGKYEEKHARRADPKLDDLFTDHKTHLFTLVISSDNSYEILVDQSSLTSGSLLADLTPPVNPPREISDPNDVKPAEWDDREKIPDPAVKKPDDWDESEAEVISDDSAIKPSDWLEEESLLIPDPLAVKPSDWSDEDDGEWEARLIDNPACVSISGCGAWSPPMKKNPKYRGVWSPPMIGNPDYDGKWVPKIIANPDYFEDSEPYKLSPIVGIGLELWSISDGIFFDNFLVTDSREVADTWAEDGWRLKRAVENRALGGVRGWLSFFWKAANKKRWLWGVYIVAILSPFVIISSVFCPKSGPLFKASDIEEIRKAENKRSSKQKTKTGGGDKSSLNDKEPMRDKSQLETPPTGAEGEEPAVAASEYVDSHSDDADDEDVDDDDKDDDDAGDEKKESHSNKSAEGSTARRRKVKTKRDLE